MTSVRSRLSLALCIVAGAAMPGVAQDESHTHQAPPRLGTVVFPNSGAAAAQPAFLRGIALLHSFVYDDAASAFQNAERADPSFALPYWFEALTNSAVMWGIDDPVAARKVLEKLGPTPATRLAKARTPRERSYGAAIEAFYADTSLAVRARGLADTLAALATRAPSDLEAAAFAAVAEEMAAYTARGATPAELRQRETAAIDFAERVFRANPNHPGAAHYLIHVSDIDNAFAVRALPAARAYARIAPDAEHAQHMPSHVFLKLGMWDDQVASNERAWAASRAEVKARGRPNTELDFHDMLWLEYGYLEQGRWAKARALIDTAANLLDGSESPEAVDANYITALLRGLYAMETGRWPDGPADSFVMAPIGPASTQPRERAQLAASNYARLLRALMLGDTTLARLGATDLSSIRAPLPGFPFAKVSLEAIDAHRKGDLRQAIALMRRAAATEDSVQVIGPPAFIRAHEYLGSYLLEAGDAAGAVTSLEQALKLTPNRSATLLLLARARASAGDEARARDAYEKLSKNWHSADRDVRALLGAR